MGLYEGSITTPPQPHLANVPGVVMLLKNFGQTPGYKTVSWIQVAVIEPINEHKLVVPEIADKSSLTRPSNGTSTKTLYYSRPLTTTEISDVLKGIRSIYVYGRVEYRDVYGKKHYSNFRLSYTGQFPPAIAGTAFTFSDKGNESV